MRVYLNGKLQHTNSNYENPYMSDRLMYVYVANPWHHAADATIKNVNYQSLELIDGRKAVAKLERMVFLLTETLNNKYISRHKNNIPGMRRQVAELSRSTKDKSMKLHTVSAMLQQRNSNLYTLHHNKEEMKRHLTRQRLRYRVSLGMLILVIVAYLALFVSGAYSAVYLAAALVIAVVVLYVFRETIQKPIRDLKRH